MRVPSAEFPTIDDAVAAARDGATIVLAEGVYEGRVVVTDARRVNVVAEGNAPATIAHRTRTPYESTVEASGGARVALRNVVIEHSSKSVARNYACLACEDSTLVLEDVRVVSETGSGVGVEGGTALLTRVAVQGCQNHGVLLQGGLDGAEWSEEEARADSDTRLVSCDVSNNGGDGVYVRDGAYRTRLVDLTARANGGFGVHVGASVLGGASQVVATGRFSAVGNARGPFSVDSASGGLSRRDAADLAARFARLVP